MGGAAHREASTGDGMPRRVFFVLVELTALGVGMVVGWQLGGLLGAGLAWSLSLVVPTGEWVYLLSVVTAVIGSAGGAAAAVIFGARWLGQHPPRRGRP